MYCYSTILLRAQFKVILFIMQCIAQSIREGDPSGIQIGFTEALYDKAANLKIIALTGVRKQCLMLSGCYLQV